MRNFRHDNRSGGGRSSFRGGFGRKNDRPTMHRATCDSCGKDCEVPFKPSGDKPVYCSDCFESKGSRGENRSGGFNRDRRDFNREREGRSFMHRAVCDQCGKDCEVPFKPSPDKPVYCSDCFEKRGSGRSQGRPGSEEKDNRLNEIKGQLNILNSKIDQIMSFLFPDTKKGSVQKDEVKVEVKKEVKEKVKESPSQKTVKKTAPKKKKLAKKQTAPQQPEDAPVEGEPSHS